MSDFPDDRTLGQIGQPLDVPHHDVTERHLIEKVWGVPKQLPEGLTEVGSSPIPARLDHKHEASSGSQVPQDPIIKFFHAGVLTTSISPNDWLNNFSAYLSEIRSNLKVGTSTIFRIRVNGTPVSTITQSAGNKVTLLDPPVFVIGWLDPIGTPGLIDCEITSLGGGSDLSVHCLFDLGKCDLFERAEIGSSWVIPGPLESGTSSLTPSLASGSFISPEDNIGVGHGEGSIICSTDQLPDSGIEILIGDLYQGFVSASGGQIVEGQFYLYAAANQTDKSCIGAYVTASTGSLASGGTVSDPDDWEGEVYVQLFIQDAAGVRAYGGDGSLKPFAWQSNPDITVRLEVWEDGGAVALVNGTLIASDTFTRPSGNRVGFGLQWHNTNYTPEQPDGSSYKVRQACIVTSSVRPI